MKQLCSVKKNSRMNAVLSLIRPADTFSRAAGEGRDEGKIQNFHRSKQIILILAVFGFFAGVAAVHAQFTDDLANKRATLVWMLRDLGPLPPDHWTNYSVYAVNEGSLITDYAYHPMGFLSNSGNDGVDYFYTYDGTGNWVSAYPGKAATGLAFNDFGLFEDSINPYPTYYHFSMASVGYNCVGLEYNGLLIVVGTDGSGMTHSCGCACASLAARAASRYGPTCCT